MSDQPETPTKPAKAIVELFIAMNEDGDWRVATSAHNAAQWLRQKCGGTMCRIVKRTYLMSPPKILDAGELDDILDDEGETTKIEVA